MIDIHSHILSGLDDGAKSMDETLAMIGQLHAAGFKTLIGTPHVMEGKQYLSPQDILAAIEDVRQHVAKAGLSVQILPGAENYIFPEMAKWASEGKLLTLGNTGKYLLLELPMLDIPRYTEQVFFELQVKGFTPILAHPERYRDLADQPERLLEWARKGVLFQLDLRSVSGRYGPRPQRLAELMLHSDLVHFIGSDAHGVARSELAYQKALERVRGIVGEIRYRELVVGNALEVVEGRAIQGNKEYSLKEEVRKTERRGFWSRLGWGSVRKSC